MAGRSRQYWPEHLAINILLQLPVKSIVRFKCVSKTWRSLFEDPSFVSQHLSTSKSKKEDLRLLVCSEVNNNISLRLFLNQTLASYQDLSHQCPVDLGLMGYRHPHVRVYDGLLCLFDRLKSSLSLWNPATREFRLLPEYNENIQSKVAHVNDYGFGSDPKTNDYKLIYIRKYFDLGSNFPRSYACAVYRMSTNSWRVLKKEEVELVKELYVLMIGRNNACVNGVCYWIAQKGNDYKVLAFDMGKEVFELIEWPTIPQIASGFKCQVLPLSHIDGISLWISGSKSISYTDIWVLSEHKHWTKLLRIGPLFEVHRLLGYRNIITNDSNKIIMQFRRGKLLLFDIKTHEFTDLGIKTMASEYNLNVCTYQESLATCRR